MEKPTRWPLLECPRPESKTASLATPSRGRGGFAAATVLTTVLACARHELNMRTRIEVAVALPLRPS